MPLRHVDPHETHGSLYKTLERFGRSRFGQFYARHVARRIDPWMYRISGGWLTSQRWTVASAPLRTTGARTGRPHEVQLAYFHDERTPILVASNFGHSKHPHWYYNLLAHPECELGGDSFVAAEVTDPDEYARLFALAEQVYAGYGDYRVTTASFGRHIPVLRLDPR